MQIREAPYTEGVPYQVAPCCGTFSKVVRRPLDDFNENLQLLVTLAQFDAEPPVSRSC